MKKIGILGGSFNPIHNAHVKLAKAAFDQVKLDEMLIIPTYITNLKDNSFMVSADQRLKMCKLAVMDIDNFYVSDIDIRRKKITYTCDTINELKTERDADYYLILGADAYLNLYKWMNYRYILDNAYMIVAPRDGIKSSTLIEKSKEYNGLGSVIMENEIEKLSSTLIRDMIKNGEDAKDYLSPKVYRYIKENGLYGYTDKEE